jgi:hypothetical protein
VPIGSCPQIRRAAEIVRWKSWKARWYYTHEFLPRLRDPEFAIRHVFGRYADQAISVAACESGDRDGDLSPSVTRAHNGQYLGMFQMGSYARSRYGHGDSVLEQVRAAWGYFRDSGKDWSPWSCKP